MRKSVGVSPPSRRLPFSLRTPAGEFSLSVSLVDNNKRRPVKAPQLGCLRITRATTGKHSRKQEQGSCRISRRPSHYRSSFTTLLFSRLPPLFSPFQISPRCLLWLGREERERGEHPPLLYKGAWCIAPVPSLSPLSFRLYLAKFIPPPYIYRCW